MGTRCWRSCLYGKYEETHGRIFAIWVFGGVSRPLLRLKQLYLDYRLAFLGWGPPRPSHSEVLPDTGEHSGEAALWGSSLKMATKRMMLLSC